MSLCGIYYLLCKVLLYSTYSNCCVVIAHSNRTIIANGHKQPQPTIPKLELIAYNFIHRIYEYLKTLSKVYCKG